jgi:excisionase family DNA binding protein
VTEELNELQLWLTIDQAAQYLNTTVRHIRELVYRREISFSRAGRLLRFDRRDLDEYMSSRRVPRR